MQTFPKLLIDSGAQRGTRAATPLGEHLRKGRNEVAVPADTNWEGLPVFAKSMTPVMSDHNAYKRNACFPPDWQTRTSVPSTMISHYAECRLTKRSPVKPSGS